MSVTRYGDRIVDILTLLIYCLEFFFLLRLLMYIIMIGRREIIAYLCIIETPLFELLTGRFKNNGLFSTADLLMRRANKIIGL
jgi:hypothetical protein